MSKWHQTYRTWNNEKKRIEGKLLQTESARKTGLKENLQLYGFSIQSVDMDISRPPIVEAGDGKGRLSQRTINAEQARQLNLQSYDAGAASAVLPEFGLFSKLWDEFIEADFAWNRARFFMASCLSR